MTLPVLFGLVCLMNIISFFLMGADKNRARRGAWRVRERTLWISAICFGALGAMAGMLIFRHKTLHASFAFGFPLLFGIQLALLILIVRMIL